MDDRTDGDVLKLKGVAGTYVGTFAGENDVAYVKADRSKNVSLLSVFIGDESDTRGTVGIVLDCCDFAWHAELVALEVDYTILDSAASAAVAHGDAPIVIASRRLRKRNDQTAFRLRLRYLGEVGRRHLTAARRSGTIFFYTH